MALAKVGRKLRRTGKDAFKFKLIALCEELTLQLKADWSPSTLKVSLQRGHRRVSSSAALWKTDGLKKEGKASWDPPSALELMVTLYKAPGEDQFEEKEYKFQIENRAKDGETKILAAFYCNVADYAALEGSHRVLSMQFKPSSKKIASASLDVTIETEFVKQGKAGDEDMMSTFSRLSRNSLKDVMDDDEEDGDDVNVQPVPKATKKRWKRNKEPEQTLASLAAASPDDERERTTSRINDWLGTSPGGGGLADQPVDALLLSDSIFSKAALIDVDGAGQPVERLLSVSIIGVYFSAEWCPPCRDFIPKLTSFYKEVKAKSGSFEILWISSDKTKEAMMRYARSTSMPWLMLEYDHPLGSELRDEFEIAALPTLYVVDAVGNKLDHLGRATVEKAVLESTVWSAFNLWEANVSSAAAPLASTSPKPTAAPENSTSVVQQQNSTEVLPRTMSVAVSGSPQHKECSKQPVTYFNLPVWATGLTDPNRKPDRGEAGLSGKNQTNVPPAADQKPRKADVSPKSAEEHKLKETMIDATSDLHNRHGETTTMGVGATTFENAQDAGINTNGSAHVPEGMTGTKGQSSEHHETLKPQMARVDNSSVVERLESVKHKEAQAVGGEPEKVTNAKVTVAVSAGEEERSGVLGVETAGGHPATHYDHQTDAVVEADYPKAKQMSNEMLEQVAEKTSLDRGAGESISDIAPPVLVLTPDEDSLQQQGGGRSDEHKEQQVATQDNIVVTVKVHQPSVFMENISLEEEQQAAPEGGRERASSAKQAASADSVLLSNDIVEGSDMVRDNEQMLNPPSATPGAGSQSGEPKKVREDSEQAESSKLMCVSVAANGLGTDTKKTDGRTSSFATDYSEQPSSHWGTAAATEKVGSEEDEAEKEHSPSHDREETAPEGRPESSPSSTHLEVVDKDDGEPEQGVPGSSEEKEAAVNSTASATVPLHSPVKNAAEVVVSNDVGQSKETSEEVDQPRKPEELFGEQKDSSPKDHAPGSEQEDSSPKDHAPISELASSEASELPSSNVQAAEKTLVQLDRGSPEVDWVKSESVADKQSQKEEEEEAKAEKEGMKEVAKETSSSLPRVDLEKEQEQTGVEDSSDHKEADDTIVTAAAVDSSDHKEADDTIVVAAAADSSDQEEEVPKQADGGDQVEEKGATTGGLGEDERDENQGKEVQSASGDAATKGHDEEGAGDLSPEAAVVERAHVVKHIEAESSIAPEDAESSRRKEEAIKVPSTNETATTAAEVAMSVEGNDVGSDQHGTAAVECNEQQSSAPKAAEEPGSVPVQASTADEPEVAPVQTSSIVEDSTCAIDNKQSRASTLPSAGEGIEAPAAPENEATVAVSGHSPQEVGEKTSSTVAATQSRQGGHRQSVGKTGNRESKKGILQTVSGFISGKKARSWYGGRRVRFSVDSDEELDYWEKEKMQREVALSIEPVQLADSHSDKTSAARAKHQGKAKADGAAKAKAYIEELETKNEALTNEVAKLHEEVDDLQMMVQDLRQQIEVFEKEKENMEKRQQVLMVKLNLKGWLFKRGVKGPTRNVWRRRWFSLDDNGRLFYYAEDNDKTPKGFIDLNRMTAVQEKSPETQDKNNASFNVITLDRTFELMAHDRETMQRWITSLDSFFSQLPRRK